MEVAPRYTLLTLFILLILFKLLNMPAYMSIVIKLECCWTQALWAS